MTLPTTTWTDEEPVGTGGDFVDPGFVEDQDDFVEPSGTPYTDESLATTSWTDE
jgi:hypothetical protein